MDNVFFFQDKLKGVQNNTIQKVFLFSDGLVRTKKIVRELSKNTSLAHLELTHVFDMDDGLEIAKSLARHLKNNCTLTFLALISTQIHIQGMEFLSKTLNCTMIKKLNLHSNCIMDQGAQHLAKALRSNTYLKYLNLRNNGIGDLGAKAIFKALEKNNCLENLDLADNCINNNKGFLAIAHFLQKNTSLLVLEIMFQDGFFVSLCQDGISKIANTLEKKNFFLFNFSADFEKRIFQYTGRNKKFYHCSIRFRLFFL